MSEFNSNNNDTFLSRVFGLHSIYNQLHDTYQYYDPEIDNDMSEMTTNIPLLTSQKPLDSDTNAKMSPPNSDNRLLDSESDLDLSLSVSSTPSGPTSARARFKKSESQINWQPDRLRAEDLSYNDRGDVEDDNDDILASLTAPKNNKLKFNLPKVSKAKDYLFKRNKPEDLESSIPLFNKPEQRQFRKAGPEVKSSQTIFQNNRKNRNRILIPPKERALYLWANITNMDEFLSDIYHYYRGKGLVNILISRIMDLLILIFVLGFAVFLKWGINYDYFIEPGSIISEGNVTLSDLIIPNFLFNNVPLSAKIFLLGFVGYIVLRLLQLYFDYNYKLKEIRNFYRHLISIPNDEELMTISWSTIVERLMLLKDYNSLTSSNRSAPAHYLNDLKSKVRLNAHDIANRIMRKENYMIALINKDILDLSLPLPLPNPLKNFFSNKAVLTKTLEWNLKLCINNFIFNHEGQIYPHILKDHNRNQISDELSSRFKMAAIINLILCPFIVIYFVLLYFFRYFNEYKSNPSSILGLRQYTPWAEWKLREFNELPHFFVRRLHLSVGPANKYINQFPRGFLLSSIMNLINFISGAILAVLVIMGIWFEDEEHRFWSFELTENKSALFYISIFGTIWAVTSNSLNATTSTNSSENLNAGQSSFVYDPEASIRYVAQFTHYLPSSWNNKLHTAEVKNEFCDLFSLKLILIVNEILSLILTPFILWFKVLNESGSIIDFFREYSIHVDGLGYVCYFAMFNFEEKDKNMMYDLNKRKKRKANKTTPKDHTTSDIKLNDVGNKNKNDVGDYVASEDDEEEDNDLLADYYQDDKMIKSYMYFLESYGGSKKPQEVQINGSTGPNMTTMPKESTSKMPKRIKVNQISQSNIDPSPSLMYQNPNSKDVTQSLTESGYSINYKFDDVDDASDKLGNKSGVLGMLNQFYKQDLQR